MTPKEYLSQIKDIEDYIADKDFELYKLYCLATSTTAPTDREVVQTSGTSNKVGNIGVKIAEMSRHIEEKKLELLQIQAECIAVIEEVRRHNKLYYQILHDKYIKHKKLNQIAADTHYSYDYIREAHGIALLKVGEILQKRKDPTQTHIL